MTTGPEGPVSGMHFRCARAGLPVWRRDGPALRE